MPRIDKADLSWAAVVLKFSDDGQSYEYGNKAYIGYEQKDPMVNYGLYFTPSGWTVDWSNYSLKELNIVLKFKKKTTASQANQVTLKLYDYPYAWYSAQQLYNIIYNQATYKTINMTAENTVNEQEFAVKLTGEAARNAAAYGFSLVGGFIGDIAEVTAYSMEAVVSDKFVPPVVSLKNGNGAVVDGVYYHNPTKDMTLYIDYSQEYGWGIDSLHAEIQTEDGRGGIFEGSTTAVDAPLIKIPSEVWNGLPAKGVVQISCKSQAGVWAEAAVYPFEVLRYSIQFTKPATGAIVQDNEPYTVEWRGSPPEGFRDLIDAKRVKYNVYTEFEDGTKYMETQTDTSFTVPESYLQRGYSMKLSVVDVYLDFDGYIKSFGEYDEAPYVRLYVQHTAEVGGVTVSGQYQPSPALWGPLVKVSWESTGQAAYRVRVGDAYDSGPIWGDAKEHKIPKILEDGTYAVQIMVQDGSANWGEWTTPVWVTVKNPSNVQAGTLRAIHTGTENSGVMLTLNITKTDVPYSSAAFYRNGVMIAQLPVQENIVKFIDVYGNGKTMYHVRCIRSSGDMYDRTDYTEIDATPQTDGFITASKTWLPLKYSSEFDRQYVTSVSEQMYSRHYAGREFPIYMRSGKKTKSMTLTYAEKQLLQDGKSLSNILEKRVGETVFFRNTLGMRMAAVLSGVSPARGWRWNAVTFTLQEIDHREEILYTWPEG